MSVMLLRSKGGGAAGEVTPAGDRVGVSMQADKSVRVLSSFSLPALTFAFSLQRVFERQGHQRARYGLALDLLGALNDSTIGSDHLKQDGHPTPNSQKGAT